MKKFVLFFLMAGTASANAADFPKHQFYCMLQSQSQTQLQQQVTVEISNADLVTGTADLTLSSMGVPFLEQQSNVKLAWGEYRGIPAIVSADVDMGRSGSISMEVTEDYKRFPFSPGLVKANVKGFNYPEGVTAEYCAYRYILAE